MEQGRQHWCREIRLPLRDHCYEWCRRVDSRNFLVNYVMTTVRLGSRCRSVFKTREFRLDYLTNMVVDGIEKMSFVCWHFLASRILAEISSVKNTNKNAL